MGFFKNLFKSEQEYEEKLRKQTIENQVKLWEIQSRMGQTPDIQADMEKIYGLDKLEQKQRENKVYLLNDLINTYYVHNESKHNEITCPCWEVRGFYRHYKSGKVIWVDSFKKGKQRDKVEPKPKTYIAKER